MSIPVASLVRNSNENYRGGVRIELSHFHAKLEQGGTTFKDDQQLNQNAGQTNYGNFISPLFGQTLDLTGLGEAYGVRGHSIYSKGIADGERDVPGSISTDSSSYSQPVSNVNFQEASIPAIRFCSVRFSSIPASKASSRRARSCRIHQQVWARRSGRSAGCAFFPSWFTDRMHTNGSSAAQQNLTTAAGPLAHRVAAQFRAGDELQPGRNQPDIRSYVENYAARRLPLCLGQCERCHPADGGTRRPRTGEDPPQRRARRCGVAAGPEALAECRFRRRIERQHLLPHEPVQLPEGRVRGRYQILPSLSVSANASVLNNRTPRRESTTLSLRIRNRRHFCIAPAGGKIVGFRGQLHASTLRSDINYLDPEFLIPETSLYRDNSHTVTALFNFNMPGWLGYKTRLHIGRIGVSFFGQQPHHVLSADGEAGRCASKESVVDHRMALLRVRRDLLRLSGFSRPDGHHRSEDLHDEIPYRHSWLVLLGTAALQAVEICSGFHTRRGGFRGRRAVRNAMP